MTEPRYGRFDEATFKRRGEDRNLILDGKPHRIAELVPQLDGSARWQAWPIPEGMDPDRVVFMPGIGPVELAPPPALEIHNTGEDSGYSTEGLPGTVLDTAYLPAQRPRLADWARREGLYKGHGPIPRDARTRYRDEFGVEG